MKFPPKNKRSLRLFTPLFCSISVLISAQVYAEKPAITLNANGNKDNIIEAGQIGYVGGNTKIGISIDKNLQGQVDINQILSADEQSATSAEGWFGYQVNDKNGVKQGVKGGGVKVNHLWVDGDHEDGTVHKVFGAYDRNANDHSKITAGYGQEKENLFWSGHLSKGVSDKKIMYTNEKGANVLQKAYDYGVGGEVGSFIEDSLTRVRGGVDVEWGTDQAEKEDTPMQATVSGGVQQYFYDSPHSITLDVSASKKAGGNSKETTNSNARLGYQYEFATNGTFQSARKLKRTRVEIPGTPGVTAIPAVAAIAAVPARAAKYKRQTIKTPYTKLVKTTMKLENETFFKLNSARLSRAAKYNLKKIATEIRRTGYKGAIRITGNTCGLGSAKYDQLLSERRAKTVRKFLLREGFNAAHLKARGLGKNHPKYRNAPTTGFKNRRVDIEYVSQRSVKTRAYKIKYKNVLVSAAVPGRAGVAGKTGRTGVAAVPARFIWKTEELKTTPLWMRRALRNPIRHKRTVDTYQTLGGATLMAVDDVVELENPNELIDVLANDSDGLTLTKIISKPSHGMATIEGVNIRYIAETAYQGNDYFEYQVKDSNGKYYTAKVTVTVPSSAPVAVKDTLKTGVNEAITYDIVKNDHDIDGDDLKIIKATTPTYGEVAIINDKEITYTPNKDFKGTDVFYYTISDGKREAKGEVMIMVSSIYTKNKPPELSPNYAATYGEIPVTIRVLADDHDPDGDPLTLTGELSTPKNGQVKISGKDVIYTANKGFEGSDYFEYEATDNQGHTETAKVTVDVKHPDSKNLAPIAVLDHIKRDGTYVVPPIDVLANDRDPDGDELYITAVGKPRHGTTKVQDGKIIYSSDAKFNRNDAFTYTISDDNGHTVIGNVHIQGYAHVGATDDYMTIIAGSEVAKDVVYNDSDKDHHDLKLCGETPDANQGSVKIVGNEVVYTANSDAKGWDAFEYKVCDSEGNFDYATVYVTFGALKNNPPQLNNDEYVVTVGKTKILDVLSNDSDPDKGDLLYLKEIVGFPRHGNVTITNGKVNFTANTAYVGDDYFTYMAVDNYGHYEEARVNLSIIPVVTSANLAPVINKIPAFSVKIGKVTVLDLSDYIDDDNKDDVYISAADALSGSVTFNGVAISYTPKDVQSGDTDTIAITVRDPYGAEAKSVFTVKIK